jgi:hypothetical protein
MAASSNQLITVIGRGHSGTRILSHTFYASGVFLGRRLNSLGDTVPPHAMYSACQVIARHVSWNDGLSWGFDKLHTMSIDTEFEDFVEAYLRDLLTSEKPHRGWKLPETTLAYPWIVRMFPAAKYVHIVRDPRDCLLKRHLTDDLARWGVNYPETTDPLEQRVASWKYQYEIVKATPQPEHFIVIRYEDLVAEHETTMRRLEGFLGIPLARIVIDRTRVGQWKSDRRLLPHIQPLASDMRELGYDV